MSSSADGDRIALGTTRGVAIHDGSTGDQLGVVLGADLRAGYITAADELFVTSLGGELTEHDLQTRAAIRTLGGSRGFIQQLTGTADGATIAVMGGDRVVTLYDVGSGLRLGDPLTLSDEELVTMSLSLDGSTPRTRRRSRPPDPASSDLRSDHWAEAACRAGRPQPHARESG